MDKNLYAEYLTYKVQYPTITFEEFVSMKEYCESMIKEEIEYMFAAALKGEEYNPPKGKTSFDEWVRGYTRQLAMEWCKGIKEEIETKVGNFNETYNWNL